MSKKLLISLILLSFFTGCQSSTSDFQYGKADNPGQYFSKKTYTAVSIPTYSESKSKLPVPVIEGQEKWVDMYWKAWELAFAHYKHPPVGSPLVSDFIDEAFSPNIFQWDTIFMIMFARYADHIFPAVNSLDNFYAHQHENGYICREITEKEGKDLYFRGKDNSVNPPLFSWAEVENYKITGSKERYEMVFPALEKYVEWLETGRKKIETVHGLYWQTPLGSGMDNTPRSGSGWVDMSTQMALQYRNLSVMAEDLGYSEKSILYTKRAEAISAAINKWMWNEEDGLYYDVDDSGKQVKVKTSGCFWPMLANICSQNQAEKLEKHLSNPDEFWRKNVFPTLSADHPQFKADGGYWLGSVWAPTNYAIIKGLENYGMNDFARKACERYIDAIYRVYQNTGTLWENYSSEMDKPGNPSSKDFVGWSGNGPITFLIENVIGIRPDAASMSITWYLRESGTHGIKNLTFGGNNIDLLCFDLEDGKKIIKIKALKPFSLLLVDSAKKKEISIRVGEQEISF